MADDWQEMDTAPQNEAVLVCCADCKLYIGHQIEGDLYDHKGQKNKKQWYWTVADYWGQSLPVLTPKMWRSMPMPPKHLYERKLAADILEKQVAELRR